MKKRINYIEVLKTSNHQLEKLHDIVIKAINEEQLITQKLREDPPANLGQRMADRVATFGGSWTFIIYFSVFIFIWIAINVLWITKNPFDPYPFILLNLMLSCLAAIQAPVIMMSQNRKEDKDRLRAEDDYMVNLKSEIEIKTLHEKIDLLVTEQMSTLLEIQQVQIDRINDLEKHLKQHLNKTKDS